jgi:hypothetical protein
MVQILNKRKFWGSYRVWFRGQLVNSGTGTHSLPRNQTRLTGEPEPIDKKNKK